MAIIAGAGNPAGSGGTAGTGKGLNYIADHGYAFSGSIAIDNTETTLLLFDTGPSTLVGHIQFNIVQDTPDDYFYRVNINDELVTGYLSIGAQQGTDANNALQILIAPYSKVEITAQNVTDTSSNGIVATVIGRVYA